MDHAVPKRRCGDHARLRVADLDRLVAARPPGAVAQLPLDAQQFLFEVGEERRRTGFAPFAERGAESSLVQRAEARYRVEQIVMPGRHGWS
jgi:hypothetical protein